MTGATSGIGEVAARSLARQGARIVFVARDANRAERTLSELRAAGPSQDHGYHLADLSSLAEMQRAGSLIAARESRIAVLINNAGAFFSTRQLTVDGLERTFATNHLAYFVMTHLLLERLQATPGSRIVCTASAAHQRATIDFDDLQSQKAYRGFSVYGRSKLMNILFTRELARRLSGTGVTANCLHPGFVATRFGDESGGLMSLVIRCAKKLALTPEQGAETIVYLASSPEVKDLSGLYFHRCRPVAPSAAAQDDAAAQRLWAASLALSGIGAA